MSNLIGGTNFTQEQVRDLFPVFNRLPLGFWALYTGLYVHYLDKGIGIERASGDAMAAAMVGLPGINQIVGNAQISGADQLKAVG